MTPTSTSTPTATPTLNVLLFSSDFEGAAGSPPSDWVIVNGTFVIQNAATAADGSAAAVTGNSGSFVLESGNVSFQNIMTASVDITNSRNDLFYISVLASDNGGADETLEAGDVLTISYAFGEFPSSWTIGVQAQADFGDRTLQELRFTVNPSGETLLWLKVDTVVNSPSLETLLIDNIRVFNAAN